ncbi:NAD-dependent epimerase [Spirochaetia bacterium]|nr:NAD-dependent epimerase [Spirochaetia bacterium]
MNYIVTGSAGFIGFHVSQKLLDQGQRVLGIDSINDYYAVSLKQDRLKKLGIPTDKLRYGEIAESGAFKNFQFIQLRIEEKDKLKDTVKGFILKHGPIDRIIHLAAQAGVRYSLQNPDAYISSNISAFLNILELCRSLAIPHLVYASSSSVYGMNARRPFSVHDGVDHPVSLYAATKRSNELMAHTYSHLFNIPTTGLRFFTVYGPWGRPDMAYYKFSRAIMKGEPIEIYNKGEMFRDFTYIDDIVEGILKASDHIPLPSPFFDPIDPDPSLSSAPYKIYNLGNNHSEKLQFFIETLEGALGKKAIKKYLPMQEGDVPATEADIEDTRQDLDWKPRTGIAEGLKNFAEWFTGYFKTDEF